MTMATESESRASTQGTSHCRIWGIVSCTSGLLVFAVTLPSLNTIMIVNETTELFQILLRVKEHVDSSVTNCGISCSAEQDEHEKKEEDAGTKTTYPNGTSGTSMDLSKPPATMLGYPVA